MLSLALDGSKLTLNLFNLCLVLLDSFNLHSVILIPIYLIFIPHVAFCAYAGDFFLFSSEQIALPTAPTDVIISEVAATSVRLEWSYKGPEDLQYYVIQYKPKNANQVSAHPFSFVLFFLALLNGVMGWPRNKREYG